MASKFSNCTLFFLVGCTLVRGAVVSHRARVSMGQLPEDALDILQNITVSENEVYPLSNKEITMGDLTPDLDTWVAPDWIAKNYPYYLSGYDFDGRPVWVVEMGKYQMRKLVDKGPGALALFDKYCVQATKVIVKSHKDINPEGNRASFILDFDGLRFDQFAHIPTTAYIIKLARQYRQILEDYTETAIVVNANFVTEALVNMVRPVWAGLLRIAEIYGTNKDRYVPRILRHFPKESVAPWYGGSKEWKPVLVKG